MNAIQLLRNMHADSKVRFKLILGADAPASAAEQWNELRSLLELHEQLEDRFLYAPLFQETGPGTPLGDWAVQHQADVDLVEQLVQATADHDPATPAWQMAIARIMDTLSKHVVDEEGQIFGRIEQIWDSKRLEDAGRQMQQQMSSPAQQVRKSTVAKKTRPERS